MNGMNFSPDQLRMASEMMKNMKDDDIKRMMGMMGGPSIDPSLLRNFASQMGGGGPTPPPPRNYQNDYTPPPAPKKEEPKPAAEPEPQPKFNPYEKIEKIKNRGNKLYEAQRYKEACQLYFEGIMEVEDMFDNGVKRNPEITAIELSCRRNYALGKMAQKEFKDAHSMLEEVLRIAPEDAKALIKISECSLELGQPQAAGAYLERCRSQLQGEEQWKSLQRRVVAEFPASDLKPSADGNSPSKSPNVIELGNQPSATQGHQDSQLPVENIPEPEPSQSTTEPEKVNPSPPKKKKVKRDNESITVTAPPKAAAAPAKQSPAKEPEPIVVTQEASQKVTPTPFPKPEEPEVAAATKAVSTDLKVEHVTQVDEKPAEKVTQGSVITSTPNQENLQHQKPATEKLVQKHEENGSKVEPVVTGHPVPKVEPKAAPVLETPISNIPERITTKTEPIIQPTPTKSPEAQDEPKKELKPTPAPVTNVEPVVEAKPVPSAPELKEKPVPVPQAPVISEAPSQTASKTPEERVKPDKPTIQQPATPEAAQISTDIASNKAVYYTFMLANHWQLFAGLILGYILGKLL